MAPGPTLTLEAARAATEALDVAGPAPYGGSGDGHRLLIGTLPQ